LFLSIRSTLNSNPESALIQPLCNALSKKSWIRMVITDSFHAAILKKSIEIRQPRIISRCEYTGN